MELIDNFERNQLAPMPWCAQLRTLFHFNCSIPGERALVNSNDLNFNDVTCFVARTKLERFWDF